MPSRNFHTARLRVHDWQPVLADKAAREGLERALHALLTPRVLEYLPPALQLAPEAGGISSWIDSLAGESDVMLVDRASSGDLIGLVILAEERDAGQLPTLHVGYLFAEAAWGEGLATELLSGLVSTIEKSGPVHLIGGVDTGNPASARVLQKAGFVIDPGLSTPGTDMYILQID